MFKAVLEDIETVKNAFVSINEILDETVFYLTKDGMKIDTQDRAGVAFINLFLKEKIFKEFVCEEDKVICINMQELYASLKLFKGETTISMEGDHTLVLSQAKPNRKIIKTRLLDIPKNEGERYQVEKLQFKSKIEINSSDFHDVIKESEKYGAYILFDLNENRFRIYSKADMSGLDYDYRIEKGNESLFKLDSKEPCHTIISREYVQRIAKSFSISPVLKIEMDNEFPMKMMYVSDNVVLTFFIAPQVESTLEEMVGNPEGEEEESSGSKVIYKDEKKTIIEDE